MSDEQETDEAGRPPDTLDLSDKRDKKPARALSPTTAPFHPRLVGHVSAHIKMLLSPILSPLFCNSCTFLVTNNPGPEVQSLSGDS